MLSVRPSLVKIIFHTKHFSSPFSRGTRRSSLSYADRNLHDNPLLILKFRSGNGCQASWQASVRISEGADNQGPDNRGSTVHIHSNDIHGILIRFMVFYFLLSTYPMYIFAQPT